MYRQIILSSVLINFISAAEQDLSRHGNENNKGLVGVDDKINTTPHNITYIDKAENLIRLPALSKYYEERKTKRKTLKKSPRRTIQKIIKKNRSKIKKLYIIKMTSYPTVMPKVEFEAQEEFSPRKEETTTPSNQKKKIRKYNTKLPRFPRPFHQMQTRKSTYKRDKREDRDLFVFKDLNEMQFLKEKKDYNVLNAHFKKYW